MWVGVQQSQSYLIPYGVDVVYSKETELWSSDQEASPPAGKNTGIVLQTLKFGGNDCCYHVVTANLKWQ